MSEGKYVEEVYRRVCEMKDTTHALDDVMKIANDVANEHPLQYERFRIWSQFVRTWRWVTSATCFDPSGKSGGSNESGDGT